MAFPPLGTVFVIIWEIFPWENIFNLSVSAAYSEFCEWVRVGIDVYILHQKYQIKSHSPPWFSAASAAAIIHRNHFQTSNNGCKSILEAAKLAYDNKTKLERNLALGTLGKLLMVFLTKVNLLYLLYSMVRRYCFAAFDKAILFTKIFSKNSNLDGLGISLPVFPSRTNLNLHNISATPKMVKKVRTNLDS